MQTFSLGFSPCPNDTFIFDALVNQKIDTEGIEFTVLLEDVQTLNDWAKQGKLDISKISYGVLPMLLELYIVLQSGGALGKGVGPLLISSQPVGTEEGSILSPQLLTRIVNESTIAIPGENTTAHFLFSQAFPAAKNKVFMRFDEIEEFVITNWESKLDDSIPRLLQRDGQGLPDETSSQTSVQGVIIHENRFTYQQKGLYKIVDLGEYWEKSTGFPIPLGGIVMKKAFGKEMHQKVNGLIRKSIEYAFSHYPLITDYVKMHSQEMSETVMQQHIDLYVNDFSLDMGVTGKAAIKKLLETLQAGSGNASSLFVG